jgi:hypothetical protein
MDSSAMMTFSGVMAHEVIEALFSENMKPLSIQGYVTLIYIISDSPNLPVGTGLKGLKGL